MKCLLRRLWQRYRVDSCRNTVDVGEDNNPVNIFGVLRKSNKRFFTRSCIILDVRPFEMWDREMEKDWGSRMHLFDGQDWKTTMAILFECEDGERIMGYMSAGKLRNVEKVGVGERCRVSGEFDYIRELKGENVRLFFRIKELVVV